jgi:hypothetical protein
MNTFAPMPMLLAVMLAGHLPAQASLIVNEILADPASGPAGDANGDGIRNGSQDEFIELVNVSDTSLDIGGWTISDLTGMRHRFDPGATILSQMAVVVFGGGTPTGLFGGAQVLMASSGSLGLNNGGDEIRLLDAMSSMIDLVSYGSEGGADQSITLDPDLAGTSFVRHSTAFGSGGIAFSPGTRIDGMPFGIPGVPEPAPLLLVGLGICSLSLATRGRKGERGANSCP